MGGVVVVALIVVLSQTGLLGVPAQPASSDQDSGSPSQPASPSERPQSQSPELPPPGLPPQSQSAELLRCTGFSEPTNFTAYSLGDEFEGLPLTRQERVCTQPYRGGPPDARLNIVAYSYGDCQPLPGAGCALPLEVQNWPRCEREPAEYTVDHHNPLNARLRVRGVPAHVYEHGLRVEVYAGRSTIVVFGTESERVLRAARSLVKSPARPDAPVYDGDASQPLPAPPAGPIPCAEENRSG